MVITTGMLSATSRRRRSMAPRRARVAVAPRATAAPYWSKHASSRQAVRLAKSVLAPDLSSRVDDIRRRVCGRARVAALDGSLLALGDDDVLSIEVASGGYDPRRRAPPRRARSAQGVRPVGDVKDHPVPPRASSDEAEALLDELTLDDVPQESMQSLFNWAIEHSDPERLREMAAEAAAAVGARR